MPTVRSAFLPADARNLRDQIIKSQAPSARGRTNFFDLPALRSHLGGRPYSARRLPLETCYEMRTDAVIQFAELVALSVRLQSKWYIECRNPMLAQFIDQSLRQIIGRLTVQFNMRRQFGFQGLAKEFSYANPSWTYIDKDDPDGPKSKPVWDYPDSVQALIWEPPVPLRPEAIMPAWTDSGDFDGIKLKGTGFSLPGLFTVDEVINGNEQQRDQIDVNHALWVVNERDWQFGSVWGYPRFGYAYKYWWAYEMTLGILNRSTERKGDPTILVSYPTGTSTVGDQERDNQEIAFDIANMARSGSVLVVPSEVWGDGDGAAGKPKWNVTTLKSEEQFEKLESILSYLDTMKVRSMGIGEQAVMEGRGGTSSRNVAEVVGERSAEMQSMPQSEDDETINRYMIPQLIEANFPELRDEPCRKVTKTFGQGEAEVAQTLLESFANANSARLPIDWAKILDVFSIETLQGDELASFYQAQAKMVDQAQTAPPPQVPAQPNGNAGVEQTDTGFSYYAARERIELAEDETFLAQLPPTKHYEDKAILAQTRLIRKLWFDLLTAQYEDFAKFLEADEAEIEEVTLADGDDGNKRAQSAADAIVKAWRYTSRSYQQTIKRTATALAQIFSRAGELELKRADLSTEDWKPDEQELADWVRDNAAAMVRRIDNATRKQLRTFLVDQVKSNKNPTQVAAGLREHFSEFPDWRADLIAREEVRRFYNAATLFAARDAGGKQVQALDARHGPTDEDCEKRNGRLYPIEAAFQEDADEHPRGTLAWRIIPSKTELSIVRLPAEEMSGIAARLDREDGIIYLVEGMLPALEGDYLVQVGNWLEARGIAAD